MLAILGVIFIVVIVLWIIKFVYKTVKQAKLESKIPKVMMVNGVDITTVPEEEYKNFVDTMNRKRNMSKIKNKFFIKQELEQLNKENDENFPQ